MHSNKRVVFIGITKKNKIFLCMVSAGSIFKSQIFINRKRVISIRQFEFQMNLAY